MDMRIQRFVYAIGVLLSVTLGGNAIPAAADPQSKRTPSDADVNAIGNRTITRRPIPISPDKERSIGKQYAQEVERNARIIDDSTVVDYLGRLAGKLVQNSDANIPVNIRIIDSELMNAFALPGGRIYISSCLVLQSESEGELAGVLAHLIAHLALGVPAQLPFIGEFSWSGRTLVLPVGWAGYGIYEGLLGGFPPQLFQRDLEFDSDYFGLQYLYKSVYDPASFIRFIDRLGRPPKSSKKGARDLILIPFASDRVKAMNTEIAEILPLRDAAVISSADFEVFKSRIRSLQTVTPSFKDKQLRRDQEFETPPFLKRLPQDAH
jgi:beta-barrel assembly-enhancing protease